MTLGQALFYYAAFFSLLLVALIWLWLRRKVKSAPAANAAPRRMSWIAKFDRKKLAALRPQQWLTGAMWIRVLVAALVALSAGVIVVVFFFPLGAAWAAASTFIAVMVVVGLLLLLIE
ncbi:MAG: hypothetical protein EXR70_23895 [Deltaproteobacteria bacterium]|nr:hypothetical protein [Deltaproteobacteria bacterium]